MVARGETRPVPARHVRRCPGGLAVGSTAVREAPERTATLLRYRLFGLGDPGQTVAAFRAALTLLGDPRVKALDGHKPHDGAADGARPR